MVVVVLIILAGLCLLYLGAESLVRGSSAIALRGGVSPLVVGMTVVAFGTSSPELFVSLRATIGGAGDISLGNVIGSNICNIGLILGLSALIRPLRIQLQTIRFDIPIMTGASILLWIFLSGLRLSRIEGAILFVGFLVFVLFNVWSIAQERGKKSLQDYDDKSARRSGNTWRESVLVGIGLMMLIIGANLFIKGSVDAANRLGVSQAFIGLTVVALGTSLPELATSVVASATGHQDISVGNVIGSNIFNILCVLGLASFVRPIQGMDIGNVDLLFMIGLGVLILPLMKTGYTLKRWEGALILSVYGLFLYLIVSK
jgi:cation:H+ antiporter